jgi:hypothetical protein
MQRIVKKASQSESYSAALQQWSIGVSAGKLKLNEDKSQAIYFHIVIEQLSANLH